MRGTPLQTFTTDAVDALLGPPWLTEHRRDGVRRFDDTVLPSAALEEWRYSRIDELDLDRYRPAGPVDTTDAALPDDLAALVARLAPSVLVTERNGGPATVQVGDPSVTVTVASTTDRPAPGPAAAGDAFDALNAAFSDPLTIVVADGARPRGPIVVVHQLTGDGVAAFPSTTVSVGALAEASVVELSASGDVDGLSVPVTAIEVGDGAHVAYVHLQRLGRRVWQIGHQASRVGRDATFASSAIALGGDYARLRLDSSLVGTGSTTRLHAVYFGSGTRMVDFRTTQDHQAPRSTSELSFKGAVANRSRAVYTGLIHVEKGARGTNAFQANRNLVLHEGAHAESVPNLEIEDNDVRCTHASAVGPVSDDQRFYLESRGVPSDAADRLITLGFLDEVLDGVAATPVADEARRALATLLDEAETAEAAAALVGSGS